MKWLRNLTVGAVGCRRRVIVSNLIIFAFVAVERCRTDETAKCFTPFCIIHHQSVNYRRYSESSNQCQTDCCVNHNPKARFPLAELTARVDGWPVSITRQHGPSTRLVETGRLSTRPVLTGNGNRSPVNSGR